MPTERIPNLLHFLLFLALTFFAFLACEGLALAIAHPHPLLQGLLDQRLQLLASAGAYLVALAVAWFTFPAIWQRSFLAGLHWNAARLRPLLALVGIMLGFAAQGVETLLPIPKNLPIEVAFRDAGSIWFLAFFGTLVAPLFEEIVFRGFLLPAVAIAVDWVRIPRSADPLASLEHLEAWRVSQAFSPLALTVASLVTSLAFALIHAPQLGYTWSAVGLLAAVSLVLCFIRIRTNSVAASTVVHASYNLSVFLSLFAATSGFRHLERMR